MEEKKFKTTYILRVFAGNWNPITGTKVTITDKFIEIAQRNWHGISVDRNTIHFQNILGVNVDKHIFGATLIVHTSMGKPIKVDRLWKKRADAIKKESMKYIHLNTQRSTTDALSDSITKAIANVQSGGQSSSVSVADELLKLKQLCDQGLITQTEYDQQKKKLLS